MPIVLNKAKARRVMPTVESLLDSAKTKLLAKLTLQQQMRSTSIAREQGHILPTETIADISTTHLFPLAVKFCGEPVNKSTYATARRALLADYEIFMQALQPTTNAKSK